MNFKRFIPFLSAIAVMAAFAAEHPAQTGVVILDHDKVAAVFAHGGSLVATNNFKVMALRRDQPGEVEIHDQDTDILYVLEGSATIVTGGTANGARPTASGETRAKDIAGGVAHHLVKGDVMVIPNGVPHWFKEVTGAPFLYYMVKVSK